MRTWSTSITASRSAQPSSSGTERLPLRLARGGRVRQRRRTMDAIHRLSLLAAIAASAIAAVAPPSASAEIPAIAARKRVERKVFTDAEIADGFLKTAFGAEYHLAGRIDRIRKYNGPVRVFVDGTRADRKAQLAQVVPTSKGAFSISTSQWPTPARTPPSTSGWFATATSTARLPR